MARQTPKALRVVTSTSCTSARELGAWLQGYVQPDTLPDHPRRIDLQARDRLADAVASTLAQPGEQPHRVWDERLELQNARTGERT